MDLLVRNIGRLHDMVGQRPEVRRNTALLIEAGRVAWIGDDREVPTSLGQITELDAGGATVVPGFVDCHTHLVWAGTRREEFAARLAGQSYDGGGIRTTVAATQEASDDALFEAAAGRAWSAIATGTTTMEIKTGYGLTPRHEMRLLDITKRLRDELPLRVESTYLGAHVVPAGRDQSGYVDEVIATIPDAVAHGARWIDVFCDEGVFTVAEARRILSTGEAAGLGLRIHAEEIAHTGAAGLAAELKCASADHLEHVTDVDARAMAAADVVGVLLPTVTLSLRTFAFHQVEVLRKSGVPLAISTDCNPGTSWCESMPYVVQLACLVYGMSVADALHAATAGGARALRRDDVGHLGVGAHGDLVVLDTDHETDLAAHLGANLVRCTVNGGAVVSGH